jgi:hypothetical protein
VLLLWTAADLTNADLCALDNEGSVESTAAGDVLRAPDQGRLPGRTRPAPHVDDCFCCSRCVEPGEIAIPAVVHVVRRDVRVVAFRLPRTDPAPVYHPPLVLL